MLSFKKLGVLLAVLALSAIGAANASAASKFTASATGELTGEAISTQVFTSEAGAVECTGAAETGTISSTEFTEQVTESESTGCKAFGLVGVHTSKTKLKFTANGTMHIQSPFTITVTKTLFTAHCTVTVPTQTVGSVDYLNVASMTTRRLTITGIAWTSSGGVCGSAGAHTNGTLAGETTVSRKGGGAVSWDLS